MYGCWIYDAYGNRLSESMSTTVCTSSPPQQSSATYLPGTNRMATSSYAPGGVSIDNSGNTLIDGRNQYWYDAEGQLCMVENLTMQSYTQYIYDASGARIGEGTPASVPGSKYASCAPPLGTGFALSKRFLVDLGGEQVTELDGSNPLSGWQHSNVFAAGKLLATYDTKGIHYALSDSLGTKRVQVNALSEMDEYCTSLPFGNDLNNPYTVNCTPVLNSLSSADDATEHHFTGKERDTESGNDYFGARYYASSMGRWLSPDWSAHVMPVPYAKLGDPQSLNLYSYVLNNPLAHFDPDGHACDSLWHCAQSFLNVVEVKVTAGIQAGVSGQWGYAHGSAQATLIGAEAKSGLGGGGAEAKVQTKASAEASVGRGPFSASASANAHAQISTSDGASASVSGTGQVSVGPASASASATASVDSQGGHVNADTSAGIDASKGTSADWKIGLGANAAVGGEVSINFSQLGRAFGDVGDSLNALGSNLMDHYITPALNGQPSVPQAITPP